MKGYTGTSLSDIVDATGLTKGAIYGNFANKDEKKDDENTGKNSLAFLLANVIHYTRPIGFDPLRWIYTLN